MGLSIQDLAVAMTVYQNAMECSLGTVFKIN
ncbi:MAG: hypothetical protein P4L65_06220 [Legionella sp.]|nr:hypothetical protein [Legionella sp.]